MPLFIGHSIPGVLLCVLGTWWMYNMWLKYFMCQRGSKSAVNGRLRYTNTGIFPCSCCPRIPFEGIFKAVVTPFGMLAEYLTGFENGEFKHYNNLQHLTIYFFFGLSGVVDIMTFYKLPLPQGSDYMAGMLAFGVEGLLFAYHLHGRTPMDVQMHMFLLYVVVGCLVALSIETVRRHSVLAGLGRSYFALLQGTWLLQIAYVLYWPNGSNWDTEDHEQMMIITILFCWHNAVIFVYTALLGCLIYLRVKALSSTSVYYTLNPLSKTSDSRLEHLDIQQVKNIIVDSEDDEVL